eukprot:TRINITY_DN1064_c0_g1_i1.p1 TRINITY_DN1064_c0_g1~~TRINITY_DN1064_c0_g1_i1.p1  ORF type:complete len:813 (-),score=313.25 TRINITY_DN1064_c0_g1_i1:51-2489(-)
MQPEWHKPTNGNDKGLKVKNSLSLKDGKMSFIPQEGNRVTWYICGPTTYDHSHLGHARTYISFDIIRRILENYFGYEVFSVMNITDVDDKIILKARKRYLLKQFKENNKTNSKELSEEVIKAWEKHIVGMNKKIEKVEKDENKKESEREAEVNLLKKKLKEAEEDKKKVTLLLEGGKVESLEEIFTVSEDALQDKLDSELGHTVVDNNIYRKLAAEFEEEYLEDMRDLNVQMPDVLTRVTEFIPEVISYVEKILENEFAYVSNGSVYFDTVKFSNHQNHHYGKLEPSSVGIDSKLEEGEGALTTGKEEKKWKNDFALWKKSKEGEPSWDSPWGKGRPGWHIECSAMASSLLNFPLDIHSGGVDLKFPHHDNELAQSEAYFDKDGCKQWVNYFLHSGHLHIDGLKMAKSLKNFISIRGARKKYSATQLRLYFATRAWDGVVNYTELEMTEVQKKETTFQIFYSIVGKALRFDNLISEVSQKWSNVELTLHQFLLESQTKVDNAFKDNFDTPTVIAQLLELSEKTIAYVKNTGEEKVLKFLLSKISRFVTKILNVLGLIKDKENAFTTDSALSEIDILLDIIANFRKSIRELSKKKEEKETEYFSVINSFTETLHKRFGITVDNNHEWSSDNPSFSSTLNLYVNLFTNFRKSVLEIVKSKKDKFFFEILTSCDTLRDKELVPLGIELEDDSGVLWKRVPTSELLRKKELNNLKGYEKRLNQVSKELQDFSEFQNPPKTIFEGKYKDYDEKGVPSINLDGKPVNEKTKKKLEGILSKYTKNYELWKSKIEKNPNLISQLKQEEKDLQNKINNLIN